MRIALVTETFYPAVDGTTTTIKAIADRLIDTGHEVCVVAPGPGLATYRRSPVVRIRPFDKPGSQVREALERLRPDLVHVTNPGRVGRKALKHAARMGIASVAVQAAPVHDVTADYWRAKVADRAGAVLVTAGWMREHVVERGAAPDRTALWLPGVDTATFSPTLRDDWLHRSWARAKSPGGPLVVVGFAGSLDKRHDVRRLAELAEVPGIRPVIIGDGPQRDWLAARLPGARFTGTLGTGDLATALASLDVLVHPGESETCCHALREAGASGVPVVAPRAGGARDVVRPLETGLLYDPREPLGLARAVHALAGDSRRELLGRRARELATRDWRAAVDELVERHHRPLLRKGLRATG